MKRFRKFGPNAFKPKMKGGMPRMKKFVEGGQTDEPEVGEGFSAATNTGASSARRKDEGSPKSQSFDQAFAAARRAGLKTFTWRGGTYGTKLKGEGGGESKPTPSRPAAPAATPSRPAAPAATPSRPAATSSAPMRSGPVRGRGLPGTREIDRQYQANRRASYGDRVLSPFITALGNDSFDLRREEDVMNRMGVDRAEARRRLAKLDAVEEREGKAPGITEGERESAKTAASVGSLALGTGAAGLAALRGGATAARAGLGAAEAAETAGAARGAAAAARTASRRGIGSNRAAAERRETEERYRRFAENKGMGSGRGVGRQYAKGGSVKAFAKGGSVRGGGCETKGKTRGRFV